MQLSIIIPTFNEEDFIFSTLEKVIENSSLNVKEVIVCDGGSTDNTQEIANRFEKVNLVESSKKGRAVQMNYGASFASADLLFFLHADTVPPINFDAKIIEAINKGFQAGCFRLSFDWNHPMLNFYSWCTKFDIDAFRYGDQGLFISREIFQKIGGFKDDYFLMEDYEIIKRIKKQFSFKIMADKVITSARKYRENGPVRLEFIFLMIYALYHFGVSQKALRNLHKELIN